MIEKNTLFQGYFFLKGYVTVLVGYTKEARLMHENLQLLRSCIK
jgi:hypothetical protein